MARASLGTIDPSTTSGTALAAILSARDAAENSGHAGTGRPSYAVAGMIYTDDSFTPDHIILAGATALDDVDLTLLFSPRPGSIRETAEVRLPSGWLWADGAAVARATYPDLLEAIAPSFTGTTNGTTTISSVSEDLRTLGLVGAKIEGTDIPSGATITAIAASTVTISAAATGSHAGVTLRAFPYGNGNGSTTFNTPNKKGRVGIGRGDMGGTDAALVTTGVAGFDGTHLGASGGAQGVVLVVANLPVHSHSASTSGSTDTHAGHTHTDTFSITDNFAVASGGSHSHNYYKTSGSNFGGSVKTDDLASGTSHALFSDAAVATTTHAGHSHGLTGSATLNGSVSSGGAHSHVLTLSTTVGNTGSDTTHLNVQPSVVSNFLVKT